MNGDSRIVVVPDELDFFSALAKVFGFDAVVLWDRDIEAADLPPACWVMTWPRGGWQMAGNRIERDDGLGCVYQRGASAGRIAFRAVLVKDETVPMGRRWERADF